MGECKDTYKESSGRNEYLKRLFGENFKQDDCKFLRRQKEALNKAHDIRKFEIELYWKRTLYFWGFQVVIFAGLVAAKTGNNPNEFLSLIFSILGLMISVAWYFVNIGAKFWHENWELHIDLLEQEITGNLHKNILSYSDKKNDTYSVSRINTSVSIGFLIVWFLIIVYELIYLFFSSSYLSIIKYYLGIF